MAYYPTNFYSSYPQQQFPQYQYQYQPQQQNNLYTGLQGKVVDSEDMVKVTDVPVGSYGDFHKADLSEVYIKTWNSNGTTSILTFKPVINSKTPQEEEKTNNMLFSKIEELEAKINSFLEQKTTTSTSSGTVKRKEF